MRYGDCVKAGSPGITLTADGIIINRSQINDPFKLRNVCASGALKVIGGYKSVDEIMQEITRDIPFYDRSYGGVTLSGGEPLSEGADLAGLLNELKKRTIDVAIETSLHVPWENVQRTIGLVNTYLVDLKHTDRDIFRKYTAGDPDLVFRNLEKLSSLKEHIIIRIPVVPGFNHTFPDIKAMTDYISSLKTINEIHFIPFHNLGAGKYKMLGLDYLFINTKSTDPSELSEYVRYANDLGFNVKTGG